MKKNFFLMVLCVLCTLYLWAQQEVSVYETQVAAKKYAETYLNCKLLSNEDITNVYEYTKENKILMREVCFKSGVNVVLSGYKSCLPVLMYSTNGESVLSGENVLPGGLQDFIDNFCGAILYAAVTQNERQINPEWIRLLDDSKQSDTLPSLSRTVYGPYLTTEWGQSLSNDNQCDAYNFFIANTNSNCSCSSRKCPTGCVATAMAQIMNYWKYPVYNSHRSYQYDWCNMPDELNLLNNNNYLNELTAIGILMAECGSAANMNYCYLNDCQSFAWPINARNALVNDFGYSSDASRKLRSSYTTTKWRQMIIDNLKVGWPVLYAGVSYNANDFDEGGHAFVCDGYNSSNKTFHFNWGHRSSYLSLWCTIDNIIEGAYNWNHLERAVFNIYPETPQDYCDFTLPLEVYYHNYYNILGNTTPLPHENVPYTLTRLQSALNTSYSSSTWYQIPSGATSEYKAHEEILLREGFYAAEGCDFLAYIVPCGLCDENAENLFSSETNSDDNSIPPTVKSLQQVAETPSGVSVYPNPVTGILHIALLNPEESVKQVLVTNLLGNVVLQQDNLPDGTINTTPLATGMYIARISTADGKTYHAKFVKK